MSFNKINNITGWIVCLIACTVYILTAEAGGSLWDCGEFVSSAFKLQIPHPPGAPLFVLIGRFFIILFGDNNLTAAKAVNIMSALASGFTILFLFWTITHFGRKIITRGKNVLVPNGTTNTATGTTLSENLSELSMGQTLSIMGAGAVGALAYTFSDSFWYSAVEGEVYALSSFFTALVFWAILKWEYAADKDDALKASGRPGIFPDRWLIFIFFMMGLSIGVHLLNLLCIPAIVMVYYFKRFKTTNWGTFWAFVIGCVVTGFVQKVVIQYTIDGAGYTDIFAVNSLGLPFFSGFAAYFILMAALIAVGLRFKAANYSKNAFMGWFIALSLLLFIPMIVKADGGNKFLGIILAVGVGFLGGYFIKPTGLRTLKLALWSFAFMLIGYSSYITTMIRSNANPAVDMYNVDNPMSLVGYLGREQYGDFPLLYGQKFTAQPTSYEEGANKYQKAGKQYIENGKEGHYVYEPADMMLFPRVWDASNDQGHADYYAQYLGINKYQDGSYDRTPNFVDNVKWYVGYQNYFMYIRYFLWNFSGKQNDVQGSGAGNVRDGNWITGINFIDNIMYGDQSKLPSTVGKDNKAHNQLFALPLILGLIGMFYHYNRHKKDFLINFLLFFFTGFAIVVYLNQAGNQPRERDYAYVGSFYAFAVWIGLGVLYLIDLAFKWDKKMVTESVVAGGILSLLVFAGSTTGLGVGPAFMLGICIYILYLLIGIALPFVLRFLSNYKSIVGAAILIGLFVPAVMASQEWDDHDRSHKELARDLARDYLESCAPNAILFSFGDNDTYPLWYAQEVEGIRPDVRVINYSLMGIDWYINQFRYKVNNSAPIDVIFTPDQLEGRNRDYIRYQSNGDQTGFRDLNNTIRTWIASNDPSKMTGQGGEDMINTFPTHRFSIPVNTTLVKSNGTVGPKDTAILPALNFEVSRNIMMKNDLAVLGIVGANDWKRPIYFTSPSSEGLGLDPYLRRDGMAYRLVPIANGDVNPDWMFDKLMNKFASGNANRPNVYFDEENRRHLNNIRQAYADLANYLGTNNRKEEGRQVLGKMDKLMLQANMPYGMTSRYSMQDRTSLMCLEAAYRNEDKAMITKIATSVKSDLNQQMDYYAALGNMSRAELENMLNQANQMNNTTRGQGDAYLQSNLQGKQQGVGPYEISQAYNLLMTMSQMEQMYKQAPSQVEVPQKLEPKPMPKVDGTSTDTNSVK